MDKVVKKIICVICMCLLIVCGCVEKESIGNSISKDAQTAIYNATMKRDILCMMMAYPQYITNVEQRNNGDVYVVMKSNKKILYDDKKEKNIQEKLNNPDLQDMMEQIYPLTDINRLMEKDFDPGRIRVYPLLKEVYGVSKEKVTSNLTNVKIGYKNYPFNQNNKAADALKSAIKELTALTQTKNGIYSFIYPISGTFNYRCIAGANRLSPHSFGTAIDLSRDQRDYWKWTSKEEGEKRLVSYPREIVKIFEKHAFIWGGKWAHFDILHFEYRPELILKARYFSDKGHVKKTWYDGIPSTNESVKEMIALIDKVLK